MRIPKSILNCVCFLGVHLTEGKDAGKFLSLGTGFFVGIQEHDWAYLHLVTAKHVLDEAARAKLPLEMRLNTHEGESKYLPLLPETAWWRSAEADLAIQPIVVDATVFAFEALPMRMMADDNEDRRA